MTETTHPVVASPAVIVPGLLWYEYSTTASCWYRYENVTGNPDTQCRRVESHENPDGILGALATAQWELHRRVESPSEI